MPELLILKKQNLIFTEDKDLQSNSFLQLFFLSVIKSIHCKSWTDRSAIGYVEASAANFFCKGNPIVYLQGRLFQLSSEGFNSKFFLFLKHSPNTMVRRTLFFPHTYLSGLFLRSFITFFSCFR